MAEVKCPDCGGSGELRGIGCRGSGGGASIVVMKCFTCGGVGAITSEQKAAIDFGEMMREDRIKRRETYRTEAARLGVDYAEWSRIEDGRLPETEAGRQALTKRHEELKAL